jgi:hypothetical protein
MHSVYFDDPCADDVRRQRLYDGQIFVYSPRPAFLAFCKFARQMIEEAFAPLDPETAQHHMPVEKFAEILGKLKPSFIHHQESKRHLRQALSELGCDLDKTYFDVPKMCSSTSDDYLTTGIAYAWHPHRDTWYSAPACQINWWMPIYSIRSENSMAFHPNYWKKAVRNSSAGYNYYAWNQKHRGGHVSQYLKSDPRPLPKPTEPVDLHPQLRVVCPVGGVIVFSGAQMHSSVPNTSGVTRFSFDFRTVHEDDVRHRRGAPNVDAACTGTTMRDYVRASDRTQLPKELIAMYDDGSVVEGVAVYDASKVPVGSET